MRRLEVELSPSWKISPEGTHFHGEFLTGESLQDVNTLEQPCKIVPKAMSGALSNGILLPARSFSVIRIPTGM